MTPGGPASSPAAHPGLQDLRASWKVCGIVFLTAVALNYPWEMLQARLYRMDTGRLPAWLHCFRASLGDGVLVLLILVGGAWIMGSLDWFRRPGAPGYAWMLVSGLVIAIAMEWVAVHILRRWSYTPAMPLLPGLEVGLVPLAQMVVLPPLIFAIAARLAPRQNRRKEES